MLLSVLSGPGNSSFSEGEAVMRISETKGWNSMKCVVITSSPQKTNPSVLVTPELSFGATVNQHCAQYMSKYGEQTPWKLSKIDQIFT